MRSEVEAMIAIKGMEMPGNCLQCSFEVNNHCHVDVDIRRVESIDKPDWCPLVEVADIHTNPEDSVREVPDE